MKVKREGRVDIQVERDRKRKGHFLIVQVVHLLFPHQVQVMEVGVEGWKSHVYQKPPFYENQIID